MSGDPVRIRYDLTASRGVRAALAKAKAPVPYDTDQGLARLKAAIVVVPASGGGGQAPTGGAVAATSAALGSKVAVGAKVATGGILGAIGTGAGLGVLTVALVLGVPALMNRDASAPESAAISSPAVTGVANGDRAQHATAPEERVDAPRAARSSAAAIAQSAPHETDAANAPLHASQNTAATPSEARGAPDSAEANQPSPSELAEAAAKRAESDELIAEMQAVEVLRTAANDPTRALALAAEQRQRFPAGRFGEEREALSIFALARLGRSDDARARAIAFLAAHPRSAFGPKVRAQTGLE